MDALVAMLARTGANLTVRRPGRAPLRIGARPETAVVTLRSQAAERAVARGDQLAIADAYVGGEIDVEGDFGQVAGLALVLADRGSRIRLLALWARLHAVGRRGWTRAAIGAHYDRPAEFFLPWFERWRSYSHGFYAAPDMPPERAQSAKLAYALDALDVRPGMRVVDVGVGWGAFLEFAGARDVRVHGITLSTEQERYVTALIRSRRLPCAVQRVDLRDWAPLEPFDGAVFMGSLEHLPDYRRVARWLERHLAPNARVYADFAAQRRAATFGPFIGKRVWPGPTMLVDVGRLTAALTRAGFNVHELHDDTRSYACTVRDWADALDRAAPGLAVRFGETAVRTFRVMLRTSARLFEDNRIQAYHLVAARHAAPLAGGRWG